MTAGGSASGGGGGARFVEDEEPVIPWLMPFIAAIGWGGGLACVTIGCGIVRGCETVGCGIVRGCEAVGCDRGSAAVGARAAARDAICEMPPLGPPGRKSLPDVMRLLATCFGFGVGLDREFGGSPCPVWIVPLLYKSSRCMVWSFTTLTTDGLPGFLLYSILTVVSRKFSTLTEVLTILLSLNSPRQA